MSQMQHVLHFQEWLSVKGYGWGEPQLRAQKHYLLWGAPKARGDLTQKSPNLEWLNTGAAPHWGSSVACASAPRALVHTRPAFPHWRFMGLVMSRFMNSRDCTCPWKQLLISEVKQLIIINNATRSPPHTVRCRRRGAKEIKLVSGTAASLGCWDQVLFGYGTHGLGSSWWKAQWLHLLIQILLGGGVLEGGQKNQTGMQNFILFICIWLLCALKHMI